LARAGTRSNRRPEPNRLATKLTTASRPAYSKSIGGIEKPFRLTGSRTAGDGLVYVTYEIVSGG